MKNLSKNQNLKMWDNFKKRSGESVPDIIKYITDQLKSKQLVNIHICTDSKMYNHEIIFSCVIVFNYGQNGCHIIYKKTTEHGKRDVYTRLWKEVETTHILANYLVDNILNIKDYLVINLDLNPNKIYKSSQLHDTGYKWLSGLGFKVLTKKDDNTIGITAADYFS